MLRYGTLHYVLYVTLNCYIKMLRHNVGRCSLIHYVYCSILLYLLLWYGMLHHFTSRFTFTFSVTLDKNNRWGVFIEMD